MTGADQSVRLVGDGLVLREWEERDLPLMAELLDDPDVALWTPLPTPFTAEQARLRLERSRRRDPLQLAVTTDGDLPLGEVVLMSTGHLGYVLGARHRGQGWPRAPSRCCASTRTTWVTRPSGCRSPRATWPARPSPAAPASARAG
jgi:hypothetical protein